MKYKNIVFDFGNVIGTFNGREIIRSFVTDETDVDYLCDESVRSQPEGLEQFL